MALKRLLNANEFIYEFIENDAGVQAMAQVTGTEFHFKPGPPSVLHLANFYLQDFDIRPECFGGIAELTNGLIITVKNAEGTVLQDFGTVASPITKHNHFGYLGGVDLQIFGGPGSDDVVLIQWHFDDTTGQDAGLPIPSNGSFNVLIQDDLSDLTEFRCQVQGYLS